MAVVTCPKCRAKLDLDEEYLGREVDCGVCGGVFVAKADTPAPPRRRRDEDEDEDEDDRPRRRRDEDEDDEEVEDRPRRRRRRRRGGADTQRAADAVRVPAILLIVSGAIGLVWRILDLLAVLVFGGALLAGGGPPGGPGGGGGPNNQAFMVGQLVGGVVGDILAIVLSLLVIMGAVRMMQVRSRGFAMTAAILSLIPCSGCCFLGLPVGIWALVVLSDANVKAAFAWNSGEWAEDRD